MTDANNLPKLSLDEIDPDKHYVEVVLPDGSTAMCLIRDVMWMKLDDGKFVPRRISDVVEESLARLVAGGRVVANDDGTHSPSKRKRALH